MKKALSLLIRIFFTIISLLTLAQNAETKKKEKVDFYSLCPYFGFSEASPEQIYYLDKPFVVKKVCGSISLEDGTPMCAGVKFEIRKKGKDWKSQKIFRTKTDENGNFCINDLKKGNYCFKVTLDGWQSAMGEIILTNKADKNSKILIIMELGF